PGWCHNAVASAAASARALAEGMTTMRAPGPPARSRKRRLRSLPIGPPPTSTNEPVRSNPAPLGAGGSAAEKNAPTSGSAGINGHLYHAVGTAQGVCAGHGIPFPWGGRKAPPAAVLLSGGKRGECGWAIRGLVGSKFRTSTRPLPPRSLSVQSPTHVALWR